MLFLISTLKENKRYFSENGKVHSNENVLGFIYLSLDRENYPPPV